MGSSSCFGGFAFAWRIIPKAFRIKTPLESWNYQLKIQFAQIELDNRRAIFDRGADKGVLVHLRDNRLKLHLHSYSHPTPFAPQTCHWIRCGKDSCTVCPWPRGRTYRPRTRPTSCRKDFPRVQKAGFTSRGSRSTGHSAIRTALAKTSCVEGGTHPEICRVLHISGMVIVRSR